MGIVDFETATEIYHNYCSLKEKLEDAKDKIKQLESSCADFQYYLTILNALEFANLKNYGRYEDTINRFLKES